MKPFGPLKTTLFIIISHFSLASLADTVPTTQVEVKTYTYSGGKLSGTIYIENIDYTKVVTVIYADGSDNWNNNGNDIAAAYSESISGTNYEYWTFSSAVDSIKEFYVKYDVSGNTYYDNNGNANYQVSAATTTASATTTTATKTTATATKTTATATSTATGSSSFPSGNTTISSWISGQEDTSRSVMLGNINPPGSATGFISASLSTSGPDYYYHWTRDAALVAHVIVNDYNTTLSGDSSTLQVLKDYVTFSVNTQSESTVCNCLGEPKFNPDGSSYTGAWGRPQNDGPAERATTFIFFADTYLAQGGDSSYVTNTLASAIYADLDYVVNNWSTGCYDLWEEVNGVHFYTLMVMRRGLLNGASFASRNGDSTRSSTYTSTAKSIATKIDSFWSSSNNYVAVSQSVTSGVSKAGYDASTIIAANQGSVGDGFYTPGSDKMLATSIAVEKAFSSLYTVNTGKASYLGNAIGRYPEDTYNGNGNSQGNPWYLCTNALGEMYYRAIKEWNDAGSVTVNSVNLGFFQKIDSSISSGTTFTVGTSDYSTLVNNVALAADKFFAVVQYHERSNGSMPEQFGREDGLPTGARDLTWSHASMISAARAKAGTPVY